jgi:hypothetical protein
MAVDFLFLLLMRQYEDGFIKVDITAASHSRLRLNKEHYNFLRASHDANIPK